MAELTVRKWFFSTLLLAYSFVFIFLGKIIKVFALFSPKLKAQLKGRPSVAELAAELQRKRKHFQKAALFFCSSAGEYEQARPLIDRLAKEQVFVHTLIFSKSGFDYAAARSDDLSFSLSPATDSVWDWGWLFAALRPSIITIVRHELWPGFIWSAKNYGSLILIDASRSLGETNSKPKKLVRAALLAMFDKIYAVSKSDSDFFVAQYGLSKQQIVISGDTKFDRVLERSKAMTKSSSRLNSLLSKDSRRLVLGSAHPADLDCFIAAVKTEPSVIRDWHIVIAPHHIDKASINLVQEKLLAAGLTAHNYMALSDNKTLDRDQILVLDTMGMLAEAYSFGTAAFVGGASHYQVHNVLEPAVHGLNLAWGPKYENSQEAVQLVNDKIATVIHTPVEFATWLKDISAMKSGNDNETAKAVGSLKGASDLIFKDWKTILNG
jgi:3-deoxy-D-manno-octulosonic-acid transferase